MLRKSSTSQLVTMVGIFAALNVVTDSIAGLPEFPSGVWYSWNFLFTPLTGIMLGALAGFSASFIGVMIGHYIFFIDVYEFIFTIGAPIGAAVSALIFKERWKPVLAYYILLFSAYFSSPYAWQLPPWGMWDTYAAFIVLIVIVLMLKSNMWQLVSSKLAFKLGVAAFIGLEADVLFRIFLLIPCQTYNLFYGWNIDVLQGIWSLGAIWTPIKVTASIVVTVLVGYPLITTLRQLNLHSN